MLRCAIHMGILVPVFFAASRALPAPIEVVLQSDKQTYYLGEPIRVSILLSNKGAASVRVLFGQRSRDDVLDVRDSDGHLLPYDGPVATYAAADANSILLEPGAEYAHLLNPASVYSMRAAGTYTLQARLLSASATLARGTPPPIESGATQALPTSNELRIKLRAVHDPGVEHLAPCISHASAEACLLQHWEELDGMPSVLTPYVEICKITAHPLPPRGGAALLAWRDEFLKRHAGFDSPSYLLDVLSARLIDAHANDALEELVKTADSEQRATLLFIEQRCKSTRKWELRGVAPPTPGPPQQ
jgi:hypothetical protein